MPFDTQFREFWRGVRRNRGSHLLAIAVSGTCLLLLTIFAVVTLNLFAVLNAARSRVEIFAFISDDAAPNELSASLKLIAGIADVRYVSKTEALAELKSDLGASAEVVDALGHNPLPASLRIRLATGYAQAGRLAEIERKVTAMPGVKEVWSGRELLGRLERIFTMALAIDVALLIVIIVSVVFIVFQSVEATIMTRSREIEVMRLVGASNSTIRGPFYWEGVFQGLMAGLVAFVLSLLLYQVAVAQLPQPFFPVFGVLAFDAILGGVLGYMGADVALSRLVK